MTSRKSKFIIACGAVVASSALIGSLIVTWRNKNRIVRLEDDDEEAFASIPLSKITSAVSSENHKTSAVSPQCAEGALSIEKSQAIAASLLEEALSELEPKKAVPTVSPSAFSSRKAVTPAAASGARSMSDEDKERRRTLPHLGVSLKVPVGWEVREEVSPIPNVAMVTVWNPLFADVQQSDIPGNIPMIILSVEDIRGENLNLTEFKNRSKVLSLEQMSIMTGGAIEPSVRKDMSVSVGPFRHTIEYAQSMLPFFDIAVINLIEVRNGVAYVFQIMCNPKVMNEYKSLFMQLAREIQLTEMKSSALGYLQIDTGSVRIHIDTIWGWEFPVDQKSFEEDGLLAHFKQISTEKAERISLYKADQAPELVSAPRNETTVDGVVIQSAVKKDREQKVLRYGGYVMIVEPLQKQYSFIAESVLVAAIKSVREIDDKWKPRHGATFFCPEYGYCFDVVGGSRVVSTKLGNGTVVYAPLGVPSHATKELSLRDQGPTVTIRIGDPDSDPDCMGSLEEWHARIKSEAAEGNISNIEMITLNAQPCLTFTSKEWQEIEPGEKMEVRGNVYIFVQNNITTLIRWETARKQWHKYERDLQFFLDSFKFIS